MNLDKAPSIFQLVDFMDFIFHFLILYTLFCQLNIFNFCILPSCFTQSKPLQYQLHNGAVTIPICRHDTIDVMTKAVKQVLMQCKVGKAQKALLTMVSTVDNQEIWIKGNSEAVKRMEAWINFARKQPD